MTDVLPRESEGHCGYRRHVDVVAPDGTESSGPSARSAPNASRSPANRPTGLRVPANTRSPVTGDHVHRAHLDGP